VIDLGNTAFQRAGESRPAEGGCSCGMRGALLIGGALLVWLFLKGRK